MRGDELLRRKCRKLDKLSCIKYIIRVRFAVSTIFGSPLRAIRSYWNEQGLITVSRLNNDQLIVAFHGIAVKLC